MDQSPSAYPPGQWPVIAHSEIEVDTVREAVIYLHALASKSRPEGAVADIGDQRHWVANDDLRDLALDADMAQAVDHLRGQMEADDDAAEVFDNEHFPDITKIARKAPSL